ncbi:hypothetical protein [Nocardia thraciensis]
MVRAGAGPLPGLVDRDRLVAVEEFGDIRGLVIVGWATDIFATLVTHAAVEADMRRTDSREPVYETFTGLPRDRFPLLTAYATELVTGDGAQRFRVAVDIVIDGLLAPGSR